MSHLDKLTTTYLQGARAGTLTRDANGSYRMPIMFGPTRFWWFDDPADARAVATAATIVAQTLEAEQDARVGRTGQGGPVPEPVEPDVLRWPVVTDTTRPESEPADAP